MEEEEEEAEAKAREKRLDDNDDIISSVAFFESISKEDLLQSMSSENHICLLFLCYRIVLVQLRMSWTSWFFHPIILGTVPWTFLDLCLCFLGCCWFC